mmetsp:Transcript_19976/g.46365  ORF Transcript_19976/g.46365 Transcript_19976/m.46365 type:complete len:450 (-) Transcript_19976:158-1507(-)
MKIFLLLLSLLLGEASALNFRNEDLVTDPDPFDTSCVSAGAGSDDAETACDGTSDKDGETCVWCNFAGIYGLCLTPYQRDIIDQYVPCGDAAAAVVSMEEAEASIPKSVVDCLINADESTCMGAVDQDGAPCDWCNTMAGFGVCLTQDAAATAKSFEPLVQCDASSLSAQEEENRGPIPPTILDCLHVTDETGCSRATDRDGNHCDWCNTAAGFGLCFSQEAAAMAKMYEPLFQCDALEGIVIEDIPPSLKDCVKNTDEDNCGRAVDEDGVPCDWCNTPIGYGVCLPQKAAKKAQALEPNIFQCDATATVVNDNVGTAVPDLLDCFLHTEEDGCNAVSSCDWCSKSPFGMSVCLPNDVVSHARQLGPLFQCDGQPLEGPGGLDPSCLLAGYMGGDADTCDAAQDEDGKSCTWCTIPNMDQGVCLTQDQASIAQQWLTCDEATTIMEAYE